MKFFLTIAILLLSILSFAQDDVAIKHYQKKWSTDTMYVACDKWESRDLLIPIPDSVYNSGTVFIKKVTYKDVRGISLSMKMSGNQITSVELSGKGKKVKKILTELKENEEPTTRGTFCVSSSFLSFNGKRTKYLNSTRNL